MTNIKKGIIYFIVELALISIGFYISENIDPHGGTAFLFFAVALLFLIASFFFFMRSVFKDKNRLGIFFTILNILLMYLLIF